MRALLRDTALEVSMLSNGDSAERSVFELRKHWLNLVDEFDQALRTKHVPDDIREDAVYAQCGLLDETALRYLSNDERSEWDVQPLQVERFGNHDAGARIYERIEIRRRETRPDVRLLECYAAVLGLGFRGRYEHSNERLRLELIAALDKQIQQAKPQLHSFVVDRTETRRLDWLLQQSPWFIAGAACVLAVLVWFALANSLDLQLANLPRIKP
jgi:type VI secretion system protein ImpK